MKARIIPPVICSILALLLLVAVTGCISGELPAVGPSPGPSDTPRSAASPTPTTASTPTATMARQATEEPTPTSMARPTLTPQPSGTPTLTPLPTLSPDEAHALVAELLRANGGCRLPCWWGFTPGQTPWDTARQLLARFAAKIAVSVSSVIYDVDFSNIGETPEGFAMSQQYVVEDGLIEMIFVGASNKTSYSIPAVLSEYGPPSEVWLYVATDSPEVTQPFYLALFYAEQGIMVLYFENPQRPGDPLLGCFHLSEYLPQLWLWEGQSDASFMDVASNAVGFGLDFEKSFRPLSEVTDLDVDTFYETFKQPSNATCLETPAEFWEP